MPGLTVTTLIRAPRDKVFRAFSELGKNADRIKGISDVRLLTNGPVGEGTEWLETRHIMGRDHTEKLYISEFTPPRSFTIGCKSCGSVMTSSFRFSEESDGTRVECQYSGKAVTLLARVTTPLAWLMIGTVRKCVEKDLADLKKYIEQKS